MPLKELYTLLNENYVEDDDNMFRFDYSPEFLLWALRPPGWLPQWHCGVRVVSSKKLVGFISAIPATIHIYDTDISAVHKLLTEYLKQFHLTPVMSREEVEHWFLPQENIIDTFVVESAPGEVTDFLSFYTLPSTIMNHPTHKSLKAAYSFYNVHTKTPLIDLMSDALILAKSVSAGTAEVAPGACPPLGLWGGPAVGQGSDSGLYKSKS
ncbi:hypothetical protein llap_21689 [Limosa lapponica baueri]|uniref:Glycylpeptide N-tetradecanoyltransferase n=1 Tax=Limosa lapponica baueri TaxID=1758121 RepID=A0A2I0T2J6_LIMLA|nr:hypothetical protein llap_21689 [Limosa lapponica baueri]